MGAANSDTPPSLLQPLNLTRRQTMTYHDDVEDFIGDGWGGNSIEGWDD